MTDEAIPALPAEDLGARTNSIDIFIDADGSVTFTDLPADLQALVEALSGFEPETAKWCERPDPQEQLPSTEAAPFDLSLDL